ncbi:MAG TPA: hypothetical protein VMI13_10790 [Solirubrobacteraceae bacterium]|nr:hypothetical protein [Solirubrobacteraceae bacterium]
MVFAQRLSDGDDADAELLPQKLLVAARLDLVSREARGVVHEHHLELTLGGVRHQPLEFATPGRLAPAGVEVAVLADEQELVLLGEPRDRLALGVG